MNDMEKWAEIGMKAFEGAKTMDASAGMLSSGNSREGKKDSIERACSQGWRHDLDPLGVDRRAMQCRALAMRLAQELPDDAMTANAVLDHARELARQLREGFSLSV